MPLQEEDAGRFSQSVLQPNSNPSLLTARGKWRHEECKVFKDKKEVTLVFSEYIKKKSHN